MRFYLHSLYLHTDTAQSSSQILLSKCMDLETMMPMYNSYIENLNKANAFHSSLNTMLQQNIIVYICIREGHGSQVGFNPASENPSEFPLMPTYDVY